MTRRLATCAAAALLAAAPAAGRAAACALRVTAAPASLVVGEASGSVVRVEGAAAAPVLAATAGTVGAPRLVAPGAWEADYAPPARGIPQVALVTATGADACGFAAIALAGQGDALVDTTPFGRITVRIGDRRFGPVRADASGRAVVPVVVPPGVRHAHHGERAIALGVPASRHVAVVVLPPGGPLTADRAADLRVVAFAVADDGAPWRGAPPSLRASAGTLSPVEDAGAGAYAAVWSLPPGAAGAETVTAALDGDPLDARAEVLRAPGAAARLTLRASRATFTAGEGPVDLAVAVADAAGNPVDAGVRLTSDGADISAPSAAGPGVWRAALVPAPAFDGRRRVEVEARAGGTAATASIALAPGAPARVEVALASAAVAADGRSATDLRARVVDAFGNEVPTAAVEADADLGAIDRAGADLRYRAPLAEGGGADAVRVRSGALSASAAVALLAPVPRLGAAVRAGVAVLGGARAAAHAGATLATYRRIAGRDLGIALDAGWTTFGGAGPVATADAASGAVAVDGRTHYVALLAGPAWRHRAGALTWWASAGAGVVHASSTLRVAGEPPVSDAGWMPAAGASIAVALRAWRALPFLEVRAGWQADPGLPHLRGALAPVSLALGYRHEAF